ncbi:50S ribosomal L19 [Micractinium conductrix]|uniref:50S ribosomal L19 n=1 Tax=Micractinium conductrix TaxID=554055 RepID=A0A2P6VBZ7_9CHLO|nr:50S ribosomal L19 [Micractinium conductrix]|eukprot:PSC71620.1 50S ribosomal L19 [Micractinium conductrix]
MAQTLRAALCRARCALAAASFAWGPAPAAAAASALETQTRPLTSLLGFRGITSSSWAAQAVGPSAGSAAPPPAAAAAAAEALPPWTPTRELRKRKTLPKRMQHLLTTLEEEKEAALSAELQQPEFGPGDLVELKLSVPENKRRVTVFRGVCIARRNRSVRTTFTLRNIYGAAGGIERTFPLYSPHITEIKVVERRKVRRAKLFYLRDRTAKELRA